jgi:predicted nucleic acid-binding protein
VILASAIAAGADYLVTRDKDLLSLGACEGISIIKPEAFLHVLRGQSQE